MKLRNPGFCVAKLVAAGFLFTALGHRSHDYYIILHWVVCPVAAFAALRAKQGKEDGWAVLFAFVAMGFNPFIPVQLKRETWAIVDLGVAAQFIISIFAIDRFK